MVNKRSGVCTSLRKSVIDKQNASKGPGPGQYQAPDSCGPQVLATRVTAPSAPFSKSVRSNIIQGSKDVPGPGAYAAAVSGVGPQVSSQKQTSPRAPFSTAAPPKALTHFVPGPQYDPEQLNAAPLSNKRSQPKFSFSGGGKRSATVGPSWVPGPGQYSIVPGVGNQVNSRLRSAPRFSMVGRWKKKGEIPKNPGPGTYKLAGSHGTQVESNRASSPSIRFGSEPRRGMGKRNGVPGPALNHVSPVGPVVDSKKRSPSAWSFPKSKRSNLGGG